MGFAHRSAGHRAPGPAKSQYYSHAREFGGVYFSINFMKMDLHCHTTASDGLLSVPDLLARAQQNDVQLLAITDHDTLEGSIEAQPLASAAGIELVSGLELSAVWRGTTIHVVGLGIDTTSTVLRQALARQGAAREVRARTIGERLAKRRCEGAYEGARAIAGNAQIGRPHFARYMVDTGFSASKADAFRKYLGAGKPGDVKCCWPQLQQVVNWITAAAGVAVLAHPDKYKMSNARLRALLTEFKSAGGLALEVVSGMQNPDKTRHLAALCKGFDFHASCGSDFHGPPSAWSDLGRMSALPGSCAPVTELLF